MSRIHNLGMTQDMQQRHTLARIDDDARKRKIHIARDIIYRQNYSVDNEAVERLLKDQSLVPTAVIIWLIFILLVLIRYRMHFQ